MAAQLEAKKYKLSVNLGENVIKHAKQWTIFLSFLALPLLMISTVSH